MTSFAQQCNDQPLLLFCSNHRKLPKVSLVHIELSCVLVFLFKGFVLWLHLLPRSDPELANSECDGTRTSEAPFRVSYQKTKPNSIVSQYPHLFTLSSY